MFYQIRTMENINGGGLLERDWTPERADIAAELLRGCPADTLADHEAIAAMITSGESRETVLDSTAAQNWPETHNWLKTVWPDEMR
jgi:hypothetical protein